MMAGMRTCPRCGRGYPEDVAFCPEDGARLGPDTEQSSLVGVRLEGRYLLEEQIGAGGLGQVYRGRHLRLDKAFAVKLLLPAFVADDAVRKRFDREAQALSRLTHPCCVGITDYGISAEHGPYIVMELVEGVALSHHTRGDGLALGESLELVAMVLRGLEHAHDQGIAHRDLKPDNIMLVERPLEPGRLLPRILDFGLAKIRAGLGAGAAAELTHAGLLVGTPAYMAPERIAVGRKAGGDDTLADIYSVGIILYELCCGRRPFVDDDLTAVVDMQLNQPPPPPSNLRPSLPAELDAVVLRALEKEPAARFPTAVAFREALEALPPLPETLADEKPAPARRLTSAFTKVERPQPSGEASPPPSTRTLATRSRRLLWAGAALAAMGLVAGGVLLLSSGDTTRTAAVARHKTSRTRPGARARRSTRPNPATRPAAPLRREPAEAYTAPAALRRAARLWRNPRYRQRAAKQLLGYLARHRTDAAAHLFVGRVYLYSLWADDGLKLVNKALRIDPALRLDDATLVALTFAYRGSTRWRARRLIDRHAGPRAPVVLLAGAATMHDQTVRRSLIQDARARRAGRDPLARRLLALARARSCKQRRAALAALEGEDQPVLQIMLSLLDGDRCLARQARRMLEGRAGPPG
jgi:serine/threonine protein kinase